MYYYYKENNIVYETLEIPNVQYIQKEKAIPVPQKNGYNAILRADFNTNNVWYELEETQEHITQQEIEGLKQNLLSTDYQAIKYAEGHITEEEYLPIKTQRQEWRNRINELEGELNG